MLSTTRNLERNPQSLKSLSSLLNLNPNSNAANYTLYPPIKLTLHQPNLRIQPKASIFDTYSPNSCSWSFGFSDYGSRHWMSTSNRPSMRSKVERRMQRESGKTQREIRRAQKCKKKIMTEEERLIYNLRRLCEGKQKCNIGVSNTVFGGDHVGKLLKLSSFRQSAFLQWFLNPRLFRGYGFRGLPPAYSSSSTLVYV